MNGTFSFYECRFSSGDAMRCREHSNPNICKKICLNFSLTGGRDAKTLGITTCAWVQVLAPSPAPREPLLELL